MTLAKFILSFGLLIGGAISSAFADVAGANTVKGSYDADELSSASDVALRRPVGHRNLIRLPLVDPMVGTEGQGTEYGGMMPMTGVPFGSMHLVPMTRTNRVGRTSFNALDTELLGFVLTRQPAIWMGDWGEARLELERPLAIESIESSPAYVRVKAGGCVFEATATAHAAWIRGDVGLLRGETGFNDRRMDANLGYPLPNFKGWRFVARTGADLKVGVSLISEGLARRNLDEEIGNRSFEEVMRGTARKWDELLSRIEIDADEQVEKIFYTGLYHCLLYPREITEPGPRYYSAFDDRVHDGCAYSCFSLWDTYRAEHPLLILLAPERVGPMLNSLVQAWREGGFLPKWPNPGYTGIMTGAPAEIVLGEAIAKEVKGLDVDGARAAIRANATIPQRNDLERRWGDRERNGRTPETRAGLTSYLRRGYVACDQTAESVSRTLDFAFADRNRNYTNLWNASARRFLPRKADGGWNDDPSGRFPGDYTECSPETALWCVPHDVEGLVGLLGGPAAFERELDRYFDELFFKPNGEGRTLHGNEPTHHTAYLYNRIGCYDKTCRRVREIQTRCYSTDRRGFDGNEDCGAMSAWYVLNALGIYPLDPVSAEYELGVPMVRRVVVKSAAFARPLVIETRGFTIENARVARVTLNGRECADRRVSHRELTKGGTLLFEFASIDSCGFESSEDALMAKLPAIFERSAAHYKALDAAATPLMKDEEEGFRIPHGFDRTRRELDMRPIYWWTSGHFPGSLWYLYEATGDAFFRDRAAVWTGLLTPVAKYEDNHDIGFMMYCSYGNARRILGTDEYDSLLTETAATLRRRYDDGLGLIRSWGKVDEKSEFLVIPDNLMNLELLEWAGGDFAAIARSHADMTMRHHFRPDGGCYHVLDYDQETGRVKKIGRGQGASCETAWSRGQSWAIYGYTMMYRTSGSVRYLDFAKKVADYAINHPNMPEDGVPYWDYGAPGEERDSSAGAIMASALVELSQYVGAADRARYRAFAVKQLLSLASPAYFSEGDEIGHFLLKHGVGHKPEDSEIDTPLNYGDYYFLEALLRFRELKAAEAKGARWAKMLPTKATLPSDELSRRPFARKWTNAQEVAEAALVLPIPDTSDELYGEYWTTGNRTRYQERFRARLANLDALTTAEATEGKGRYLPRIEDYLRAICEMKSWVWPAHDWADGGRGTFRCTWISTDLVATEIGAHLACVIRLLGDRLDPALVARVKAECERRVFGPIRREARFAFDPGMCDEAIDRKELWWINVGNNWNAVCWDNVVCCAMGMLDDPIERAQFVVWADLAAERYLAEGFAEDGYCSEGMGYWNYGFGHHLLTGRLLDELTGGKSDFFRRPQQKRIAAYGRACTLREGTAPAFADGVGAASPQALALVDRYWPDIPKELSPYSEFPDGQVWLFRDPEGLSVAFKGGHNAELHNHNDVGSYYVMFGDRFVSGDSGGEVYTANTFSTNRYASKILGSYGHPVPVVGGALQSVGRKAAAKVVSKALDGAVQTVALDLTAAYDVPELESLVRTFVYDRPAKTFTVSDKVVFRKPTAFESAFNTYLERANPTCKANDGMINLGWDVRPEIAVKGGAYEFVEEDIPNPDRLAPHRVAVRFKDPVVTAEVAFVFRR